MMNGNITLVFNIICSSDDKEEYNMSDQSSIPIICSAKTPVMKNVCLDNKREHNPGRVYD